jgi:uncharacterized damage-inducible protein DinB
MNAPQSTSPTAAKATAKQRFLETFAHENAITMKLLRAYPADQLDLRPHPTCKTARELAWMFVLESGLGTMVFQDRLAELLKGANPPPPQSWDELLAAIEKGHRDLAEMVHATPDAEMEKTVTFLTGPKTTGSVARTNFIWFLLRDQIHHRGQFSIYLRMAGAKVPSIYGPSADEPWM